MLKRTTSVFVLVLAVIAGGLVAASPSVAAADRDCPDFATQRAAQLYFLHHGGPAHDPDRLDRDNDGIACDSNPCPCYYAKHLPPPAAVTTRVRLTVSSARRIAGEPLRLTAQVLPRRARAVVLQRRSGSGWVSVRAGRSNPRGVFSYRTRTRSATTVYRARVAAARLHGRRYAGAVSAQRRVVTQPQSVALQVPASVLVARPARATVTVRPVRSGRAVVLQRLRSGSWVTVRQGRESRTGRVGFALNTSGPGTSTYRAVALRGNGAARAGSARRTMRVVLPAPPPDTAPAAPAGLTATPGDGVVDLAWSAVDATDLAGYRVYRAGSANGPWTWTVTVLPSTTGYRVTGLANGATTWFAVAAVDRAGHQSVLSTATSATPVAPDAAPAAPTGLVATPGDGRVDLAWSGSAEPDLAGYRVYRAAAADGVWSEVTSTVRTVPDYQVTGLANGTTTWFAVTAVDQAGHESGLSAAVSATPAPATA